MNATRRTAIAVMTILGAVTFGLGRTTTTESKSETPKPAAAVPAAEPVAVRPAPGTIADETSRYRLTSVALTRLIKAESGLASVKESDVSLLKSVVTHPNEDARSDWVRRINARPQALQAIKAAGLSPREYLVATGAVVRAYTVYLETQNGRTIPPDISNLVPTENVAFVGEHLDQVQSWERGSGSGLVKPNTLEDIYAPPPAEPAPPPPAKPNGKKS